MKICFLGTPSFGLKSLEYLHENYDLACVVVRPDKTKEISPIKLYAIKHNICLFQPNKLDDILHDLINLGVQVLITVAYGEIISDTVLNSFKYSLNLHGSVLPKRRGAAPIQRAMLEGDTYFGVSLIEMTNKMDAGRIFGLKRIERDFNKCFTEVYEDLGFLAALVLKENLDSVLNGSNLGVIQQESLATYTKKIKNYEEQIDFNNSAYRIFLQVKTFANSPAAYFIYNNLKFKVFDCVVTNIKSPTDAKVFIYNKKLYLAASDYLLEIIEIQQESKKKMWAKDFINGQKVFSKRDII